MKGHPDVIRRLNDLLTGELTSMDIYFVHSRMCENWGYSKLHARFAHEFDDEKGHAEKIIERILFLEGMPNMAARQAFDDCESVVDMLSMNLKLELEVRNNLAEVITFATSVDDHGSRKLLEPMLVDTEEDHILWLQTQIRLIEEVGLGNYLSEQI